MAAPKQCPRQAPQSAVPWAQTEFGDAGGIVQRQIRGTRCEWNDQRQLIRESWWDGDTQQGPELIWDELGQLQQAGVWLDGQRHGPWHQRTHGLWGSGEYTHGRRNGEWNFRDTSGNITRTETWSGNAMVRQQQWLHGELQSLKSYDVKGELLEGPFYDGSTGRTLIGHMRAGRRHGNWHISEPGSTWEGAYLRGHKQGPWTETTGTTTKLIHWDQDEMHGPYEIIEQGQRRVWGEYRAGKQHGKWVTNYSGTEQAQLMITYVDGVAEGPQAQWDSAGRLVFRGQLVDGSRSGLWEERQGGGMATGHYEHGSPAGLWTVQLSGKARSETNYAAGKKHGTETRWDVAGKVASVCEWSDGKKSGVCSSYVDGVLTQRWTYFNGFLNGEGGTFYADGSPEEVGSWLGDRLHGQWSRWHANGVVAESGRFASDARVGEWTERHSNGRVAKRGSYDVNGHPTGPWREYYPNGTVAARGGYLFGTRDGDWRFYYPNGELKKRGDFVLGNRHGTWTYYWANRQTQKRGRFIEGSKHGEWNYWDLLGKPALTARYQQGETVYASSPGELWGGDPDPWPDVDDRIPASRLLQNLIGDAAAEPFFIEMNGPIGLKDSAG